ncbi:anti-sigma factor RsbA family regulatory protein [Streptomyces sp. NPDC005931]|uniref:anti-sigma factor RsbA family regulatory protein n=1 Tax=Streptomyces sp. NPDC005931 TaxID=3364737 RepID=UPI0036AB5D18
MTNTATLDPFVHPALFYRGDDQYVAGTVPFLLDGLAAGEPVAVAAPPDRLQLIRDGLDEHAEKVHFTDMTQAGRNPGRIIPWVLRAFSDAHPAGSTGRVRIIGEPIWSGRTAAEYPACVQHEALINQAFAGREVSILCPYDADKLDQRVLADAWATHPLVIDEHGEAASQYYRPEEIVARYNQPLPQPPGAAHYQFAPATLPQARHFAVEQGRQLGLSGLLLEDLALAVAELTTNSVVHGAGSGTLRLWTEDEHIVCEVHDTGQLTDPLAGRRPAEPGKPGGRGLLMVNHLADLVRLHTSSSGTTIRIYLHR